MPNPDLPLELLHLIVQHAEHAYRTQRSTSIFALMRGSRLLRDLAFVEHFKQDFRLGQALVSRCDDDEQVATTRGGGEGEQQHQQEPSVTAERVHLMLQDEYWAEKWVVREERPATEVVVESSFSYADQRSWEDGNIWWREEGEEERRRRQR